MNKLSPEERRVLTYIQAREQQRKKYNFIQPLTRSTFGYALENLHLRKRFEQALKRNDRRLATKLGTDMMPVEHISSNVVDGLIRKKLLQIVKFTFCYNNKVLEGEDGLQCTEAGKAAIE